MPIERFWQRSVTFFMVLAFTILPVQCKPALPDMEIRHDIRYLAAFSANTLLNPEDERRFNDAFQSRYRSRVLLLRPVTGQAYLPQLQNRAALFAVIKINTQREARIVAHEIERALGGALLILLPFFENPGSQDSFSGQIFYLGFEKRSHAFTRLTGAAKLENLKHEAEDLGKDRNLLSYFSGLLLADTPYHSLHILGFSGLAESEYETFDGLYHRAMRKLEQADTALVEKIR